MNVFNDNRVVMTLDAGGTNFVFNAMKSGKAMLESIGRESNGNNLHECLKTIMDGFEAVKSQLDEEPVAISFAFPGPADYPNGVIGDLGNLPAFRGGVALGPMLAEHFQLPVFIQNDGDLFAYGEALGGTLLKINQLGDKKYKNLVGLTLGTGFGAGVVIDGRLITGDNSIGSEVWLLSNIISPERNIEEGVSARAIVRCYSILSNTDIKTHQPKDIYDIAIGRLQGDKLAAREAFRQFGLHLGDAIANLVTLFDGIVVIGGGLTGAKDLYMPAVMETLKGSFLNGQKRLIHEVFSWDDPKDRNAFLTSTAKKVQVPFSEREALYDPVPKLAIANTEQDASECIALGAYAYALSQIDSGK